MDVILQLIGQRKTAVALVGGIVLGLLVGLLIAWVIWPVQYYNATPTELRSDFQKNYLLWVAEQYNSDGDREQASARLGLEFWDKDELAATLEKLAEEHGGQQAIHLRALKELTGGEAPAGGGGQAGSRRSTSLFTICGAALLVVACVGGVWFLVNRMRGRQVRPGLAERAAGVTREYVPAEEVSWGVEGPPLVQYATTYELGDDHYDPSFSIELENGEFMGECGVGISETIGVGTPGKVTAFEVWLFDKSDIRTVTKVLMSDYAWQDEALRTKLAPKGEPVQTRQGQDLVLETKTLRVRARIAESTYGMADVPSNSFFERLTVDLAVWVLPEQEGPSSVGEIELPPLG
jgi:hypothetical protein